MCYLFYISIYILYILVCALCIPRTRGKTSGIGQKYAVRNPVIFLASWDGKYFILFYFLDFPQRKEGPFGKKKKKKKMLRYVRKEKGKRQENRGISACLFRNGPCSPR